MSAASIAALIMVVCFIFGIVTAMPRTKTSTSTSYEVIIRPVQPQVIVKYVDRPVVAPKQARFAPIKGVDRTNRTAYNEAKVALVAMGYRATGVKALLDSIGPCATAEDYVKKALTRRT